MPFGRGLGGDHDVDLALGHGQDHGARAGGVEHVSEENTATRASGKRDRTSFLHPLDPRADRDQESAAPQCGQRSGLGMEKPVRWQTSRPV